MIVVCGCVAADHERYPGIAFGRPSDRRAPAAVLQDQLSAWGTLSSFGATVSAGSVARGCRLLAQSETRCGTLGAVGLAALIANAVSFMGRAYETGKPARCSRARPTSYGANDEEVPWVPDSRAR
jgi:hypothetical protein